MSDNNLVVASMPSLVISEDHGQSFSSVVIVNKTRRQEQKQISKRQGMLEFVKNNLCQIWGKHTFLSDVGGPPWPKFLICCVCKQNKASRKETELVIRKVCYGSLKTDNNLVEASNTFLKEARKGFSLLYCLWNEGRLQRRMFNGVGKLYVSLQLYCWTIL